MNTWYAKVILWISWVVVAVLIIFLLLRSDSSNANEMTATLKGGAQVRLMNRPCHFDVNRMGGYMILPSNGDKVHGCWVFFEDKVHFRMNHGETLTIPWAEFRPVIDGSEFVPSKPITKPFRKDIEI